MYAHTMDLQIMITQWELLSLVRNQVHEATSNWRIIRTGTPPAPVNQNLLNVFVHIKVTDNEDDCAQHEASHLTAMPVTYSTAVQSLMMKVLTPTLSNTEPPPMAIIIEDPYEVYLCTALEDCSPNCLMVTKESSTLPTILPLINHNQYIKSVLDPSSQVITMSEAACHALALIYDPHIHLHMQLANREVDKTLGLTCNMPILIRDIMLYIQFHIVRNPMYNILLGRPFNILVESIIQNYSNEDQMITIHDPNSRRIMTVPTFLSGTHLHTTHLSPDFCDSRIWSAIKEISCWSSKLTLCPLIPPRFCHSHAFRLHLPNLILPFAILKPAASTLVLLPSSLLMSVTGTPCHTHLNLLHLLILLSSLELWKRNTNP